MTLSARIGIERYRLWACHEMRQRRAHRHIHPRQRHMRRKAAAVRGQADPVQGGFHLRLQPGKIRIALHPGPEGRDPPGLLEPAKPGERERKTAPPSVASARSISSACNRLASPIKRKVRWKLSVGTHRAPGILQERSESSSLTSQGRSRATNRRMVRPPLASAQKKPSKRPIRTNRDNKFCDIRLRLVNVYIFAVA